MLNLKDYPAAIANQQNQILNMRRDLRMAEDSHKTMLTEVKAAIASNPGLKNETQRKAAELGLLQSDADFQQNQRILLELKDAIDREAIVLELLLNEFSVLKLERREQVAVLMAQAA